MNTPGVTVVAALYGTSYDVFVGQWLESVSNVNHPSPRRVIIGTDHLIDAPGATTVVTKCRWRHAHAWHLQQAIQATRTEWIWVLDIDDTALSDALAGIDEVTADVWQMGYTNGHDTYVVPRLTNDEYLARTGNCYVGGSMFKRASFNQVGGYDDLGFQDWGLWRKMCRAGMTFESSGRANFNYAPGDRTAREFTRDNRNRYMLELAKVEAA